MLEFKAVASLAVFFIQFCSTESAAEVRLVNGSSEQEGRLEVFCEGQWRSVCQNYVDITRANSLCQRFGFARQGAILVGPDVFGSGQFLAQTATTDCMNLGQNCNHVGLICSSAQCQDWDVDVEASPTQICLNHTWKSIQYCSSTVNTTSKAICRQAGYSSYGSFNLHYDEDQRQLSILSCLGNEPHLSQCIQETCEGSIQTQTQAISITCKPICHLCNNMSNYIDVRRTGASSLRLQWQFHNNTYRTVDYYIANCSSMAKQGNIPVYSASKVINSSQASSVELEGIEFQYDYVCCVTARLRENSSYVVCSPTFSVSGGVYSSFIYTLGGIFFYMFLVLLLIVIVLVSGIIIACICSKKKRTFMRSRQKKKIAADLNKVFSQSILSINEKGKKENSEVSSVSTAVVVKPSSDALNSNTKKSEELVKSLPAKVDKEKSKVEYSTLVRIEKNEKISGDNEMKTSPCIAYGAVPDSAGKSKTSQNNDYRNIDESCKERSKPATAQYYEDVS